MIPLYPQIIISCHAKLKDKVISIVKIAKEEFETFRPWRVGGHIKVVCDGIIVIENKQQWKGRTARKACWTKATLGELDPAQALFV